MKSFKLAIGLATYTVRFKKKLTVTGDVCNGACDYDKKLIQIELSDNPDVMFHTFWHEFMHAVTHELGATALSEDEAFVEIVGQAIARAVRALPEGFK